MIASAENKLEVILKRMKQGAELSPSQAEFLFSEIKRIVRKGVNYKVYRIEKQEKSILINDIAVHLWFRLDKFDSKKGDFCKFIFQSTIYALIDRHRKFKKQKLVSISETDGENRNGFDLQDNRNDPESLLYNKDMMMVIRMAIDQLDPMNKSMVVDYEFQGLSIPALAIKHSISQSACYVRLFRAKRLLKQIIQRFHVSASDLYG